MTSKQKPLSRLEHTVMSVIWEHGSVTAEQVREALAHKRTLKDSTVRTVLRRLEEKDYLEHSVAGRTYIYAPLIPPQKAAARALRQIVDRFCNGSVESLLIGMVNDRMLTKRQLERLARRIAEEENKPET